MKAREAMMPLSNSPSVVPMRAVDGEMPLIGVLPRLLESPGRVLGVTEEGRPVGVIDESSMLTALGRMIAPRDDSSVVTVECASSDYSASILARAVEDADVHLVDLLSVPAPDGKVEVMLRVRAGDATAAAHSLERYGYDVTDMYCDGAAPDSVAMERLLGLQALMNV